MENLKFYTDEERYEAEVTFREGIRVKHNEEERLVVKAGDVVTVLGEFEIKSEDDFDYGKTLKQLVFSKEGAKQLCSMHESFLKEIPKETLEEGDYVRIVSSILGENFYEVTYDGEYYTLRNINGGSRYDARTLENMLEQIKADSFVKDYEILPKADNKLAVTKKDA